MTRGGKAIGMWRTTGSSRMTKETGMEIYENRVYHPISTASLASPGLSCSMTPLSAGRSQATCRRDSASGEGRGCLY